MSAWHGSWLGYPLGLGHGALLLVAAVTGLLLAGAGVLLTRALVRFERLFSAPHRERLAPRRAGLRRRIAYGLQSTGLVVMALGLAQPQCGTRTELSTRKGIDLVVALDASKSMYAQDVQPSRLERAKLELLALLEQLKGDRVALVAFAGDAYVQCPLTSDYSAAQLFLRAVDPERMPQGGTNVGAALLTALRVFEGAERGARDKVVVLLSDGEDLSGSVDEGIDALKAAGVKLYAVGLGSSSGAPIPRLDAQGHFEGYVQDASGSTVMSRLDAQGLSRIAQALGGAYYHEPNGVAVSAVAKQVDALQKSDFESRLTVQYAEMFQYFVAAGLLLWLVGLAWPTWRQGVPS